jgi:hypothetical protein
MTLAALWRGARIDANRSVGDFLWVARVDPKKRKWNSNRQATGELA